MNRELIIIELRQLEQELQQDLADIQSAIRVLVRQEAHVVIAEHKPNVVPEKTCIHCGKLFAPTSNVQKLCSVECKAGHTAKKKSDLKATTSVRSLVKKQKLEVESLNQPPPP